MTIYPSYCSAYLFEAPECVGFGGNEIAALQDLRVKLAIFYEDAFIGAPS